MRPTYPTWQQAFVAALYAADRTGNRHTVTSSRECDGERRWRMSQIPIGCVFCAAH